MTLSIEFDPSAIEKWHLRLEIGQFSQEEREEAWDRVTPFFEEIAERLVPKLNTVDPVADETVPSALDAENIHVCGQLTELAPTRQHQNAFVIPRNTSVFFLPSQKEAWTKSFQTLFFVGKRKTNSLFIDNISPLADYFYLLQCIIPGLLTLRQVSETHETTILLPNPRWIQAHNETVQLAMGSQQRYADLLDASRAKACVMEHIAQGPAVKVPLPGRKKDSKLNKPKLGRNTGRFGTKALTAAEETDAIVVM